MLTTGSPVVVPGGRALRLDCRGGVLVAPAAMASAGTAIVLSGEGATLTIRNCRIHVATASPGAAAVPGPKPESAPAPPFAAVADGAALQLGNSSITYAPAPVRPDSSPLPTAPAVGTGVRERMANAYGKCIAEPDLRRSIVMVNLLRRQIWMGALEAGAQS